MKNSFSFLILIIFLMASPGCFQGLSQENKSTSSKKEEKRSSFHQVLPKGVWRKIQKKNFQKFYISFGSFFADKETILGSQVSGIVEKIFFQEGDFVEKGKVLLKMDPTYLNFAVEESRKSLEILQKRILLADIAVRQAKNRFQMAKVAYEEGKTNFERIKKLWIQKAPENSAITKDQYDKAYYGLKKLEIALESAKIGIQQAKSNLEQLKVSEERAKIGLRIALEKQKDVEIRAPFSGVIQNWMVEVGSKVTAAPATKILRFSKVDMLKLRFPLPQKYYSFLNSKTQIYFRVVGQKKWHQGYLFQILPQVDPQSRNLLLECRIKNSKAPLAFLPGMLVEVKIKIQELPHVLVLPKAALIPSQKGWSLWIRRNKTIRQVYPSVLLEEGREVAVKGDLQKGDFVLVLEKGGKEE